MKRMLFVCLALGVFAAAVAAAQTAAPKVSNGQLDSRSVRSDLARAVDALAAAPSPACGFRPAACGLRPYSERPEHVEGRPCHA